MVKTAIELAFERRLEAQKSGDADWTQANVGYSDFREAMALIKSTRESMGTKIDDLRNRLDEFCLTSVTDSSRTNGVLS